MELEQGAQSGRSDEQPTRDFRRAQMAFSDFVAQRREREGAVGIEDRDGFDQGERFVVAPVGRARARPHTTRLGEGGRVEMGRISHLPRPRHFLIVSR